MGSFPRTTLLLSLDRIDLSHEHVGQERGAIGLRFQLVVPRPNVDGRDAVRVIRARKGVTRFGSRPVSERLLFKQTVEGPFGLRVEVSRGFGASALEELVRTAFAGGVEEVVRFAAASQLPPFRNLMREGGRFLGDLIEESEAPDLLAVGEADLASDPVERRLEVPLKVAATFRTPVVRGGKRPTGGPRRSPQVSYRKGESLGLLTFNLQIVD